MASAESKPEPRSVTLFNFTFVLVAAGIGVAVLTRLTGKSDPMVTTVLLACMGVGVPLAAWLSVLRHGKNGSLKLSPLPDAQAGGRLADLLHAFLDSPELDADERVYTFTRAHRFRGIPVSFGMMGLLPGLIFLFSPLPGLPRALWIGVTAGSILLMAAGFFWRYRCTLNLKERTLTMRLLWRKTQPVKAIGAQAVWILGTRGNSFVLDERHALYAVAGNQLIQISNFEKPHRPVFSAAEQLARAAGVPLMPRGSENTPAAIHMDWWVISLPVAFILIMVALQILKSPGQ